MGKKLTNEEFLQRLKDLGRDDLIPLEEYKGRHTNIRFKCTKEECGHEWEAQPGNIYDSQGCPECARRDKNSKRKYTKDEFNERLLEEKRFDVKLIEEYINGDTPVLFKCNDPECGHEWYARPANILYNGYTCPACNYRRTGQRNKVTQEDFEKKIKELNPNIIRVGIYKDRDTEVEFICSEGHTWKETPASFYGSPLCPICNPSCAKLISGVNDLGTLRPDLIKYFKDKELPKQLKVRSNQKVDLVCPDCGYEKQMLVYNLYNRGFYCEMCDDGLSFPNKILRNLLQDKSIKEQLESFVLEWSPQNCNDKMFFDAMIIVKGQYICVEMQGIQHYSLIWSSKKDNRILERDNRKREFCKQESIIEIEIDCRDTDFENIKNNFINSELKKWIDFSKVDWNIIGINSSKSLMIEACNIYNNSLKSSTEIAKELGVERSTVTRYLKRGSELGICIYTKEDSIFRGLFNKCKYVYIIYKNGDFLTKQYSITLTEDYFNKNYPELGLYGNLINQRARNGWIVDGFKIIRKEKTEQDIEKYLKIYQENNELYNKLFNP